MKNFVIILSLRYRTVASVKYSMYICIVIIKEHLTTDTMNIELQNKLNATILKGQAIEIAIDAIYDEHEAKHGNTARYIESDELDTLTEQQLAIMDELLEVGKEVLATGAKGRKVLTEMKSWDRLAMTRYKHKIWQSWVIDRLPQTA